MSFHKNVTQVLIYRELEGVISSKEYPVYDGFKPNQKVSSHKKCRTWTNWRESKVSHPQPGWFKPNRTNQKVSSPVKVCAAHVSSRLCKEKGTAAHFWCRLTLTKIFALKRNGTNAGFKHIIKKDWKWYIITFKWLRSKGCPHTKKTFLLTGNISSLQLHVHSSAFTVIVSSAFLIPTPTCYDLITYQNNNKTAQKISKHLNGQLGPWMSNEKSSFSQEGQLGLASVQQSDHYSNGVSLCLSVSEV